MNPLIEHSPELLRLAREFRHASDALVRAGAWVWTDWECQSCEDLFDEGLPHDALVQMSGGVLDVMQENKNLYQFEDGDLFCSADFHIPQAGQDRPMLAVEDRVWLRFVAMSKVLETMQSNPSLTFLWQHWQKTQRQFMQHLVCRLVQDEQRPTPGFRRFADGEVIIKQGDPAEYVYTIMDGRADVFVDGVKVGEVMQEEIFGAVAVLCNQPRTATVKASGACNVLMVAPHEFTGLLNSHPHMFINLLQDLAKTITALNEKVVSQAAQLK